MSCPSKTNAFLRRSNFPLTHVRRSSLHGRALALPLRTCTAMSAIAPYRPPTAGRFSLVGRSRHASIQRPHGTPLSGRFEFFSSPVILPPDTFGEHSATHADEGLTATRVLAECAARATESSARNPVLQSGEALFESALSQARSGCTRAAQMDDACRPEPMTLQPRPGRQANRGRSA